MWTNSHAATAWRSAAALADRLYKKMANLAKPVSALTTHIFNIFNSVTRTAVKQASIDLLPTSYSKYEISFIKFGLGNARQTFQIFIDKTDHLDLILMNKIFQYVVLLPCKKLQHTHKCVFGVSKVKLMEYHPPL